METTQKPTEETIPNQDLWDAVHDYNQQIWEDRQSGLTDPWSYQQPSFTLGDFGLEDEVFAVISIPKIELEMPIYLGATADHLSLGAAHLSQTSLPVSKQVPPQKRLRRSFYHQRRLKPNVRLAWRYHLRHWQCHR